MSINTGYERAVIFRVRVTINGVTTIYTYSVLEFPGVPTITRNQLATMNSVEYENRMNLFFQYIQSLHPNYVPDESYRRENPNCISIAQPQLLGEFDYTCVLEEHDEVTIPDDVIYKVEYNDVQIYDGHNFGTIPFTATREIKITNLSQIPITVSTIKSSGNFKLLNNLQSDDIPVGGSEFVTIGYDITQTLIPTTGNIKVDVVNANPTTVYISFGGSEKKWWAFQRCTGYEPSICYMEDSVKKQYEITLGNFNSGDRFYGAVEGDPTYLYTFTSTYEIFDTTPNCFITGVSRTDHTCP